MLVVVAAGTAPEGAHNIVAVHKMAGEALPAAPAGEALPAVPAEGALPAEQEPPLQLLRNQDRTLRYHLTSHRIDYKFSPCLFPLVLLISNCIEASAFLTLFYYILSV